MLLSQLASKDAFLVLRTQQQLGYVVQCGVRSVGRARGLSVLIQSSVMAPAGLESAIEEWIASFRAGFLAELTDEGLAPFRSAMCATLEEPPRTLAQEAGEVWGEIVEGTHQWAHDRDLAAEVRRVSLEEVRAFFDDHVARSGKARRKVSSQWWSQKDHAAAEAPSGSESAA